MRLYQSPASPFARKVTVLLHECGRTGEVELAGASGTPLAPGSMPVDRNPLGKIPTLERPDGPPLFDSRVICRYLDDRFAAGLYPAAPRLWDTLTVEAMADGISEAALLMRYETFVRPAALQFPDWVEGQWSKVERALDAAGGMWAAHLAGDFDMGHAAMACALGYLDLRHGARNWRAGRPGLAAWFDRVSARDSIRATVPQG
jgi:glutathione S-transferase